MTLLPSMTGIKHRSNWNGKDNVVLLHLQFPCRDAKGGRLRLGPAPLPCKNPIATETNTRASIHQAFSRTFFVFFFCEFECCTTSDWLNHTV